MPLYPATPAPPEPFVERRHEFYSGLTGADGRWSVVFGTPFGQPPMVLPVPGSNGMNSISFVARTALGFTLQATRLNAVNVVGVQVLVPIAVPVANYAVVVAVIDAVN